MVQSKEQKIKDNLDARRLRSISIDPGSATPLYAQLRQSLLDLIVRDFEPGNTFFSDKTLVENLPVSQITVSRAMRDLTSEGLLYRVRGRGTTVAKQPARHRGGLASSSTPVRTAISTVGVLTDSYKSDYFAEMLECLALECRSRSLSFQTYYCGIEDSILEIMGRLTRGPQQEALATLLPSVMASVLHASLDQNGYRSVALEGIDSGFRGSSVVTDATAVVTIGIAHLLELGHRRIALLVNEGLSSQSVVEKVEEFQRLGCASGNVFEGHVILCSRALGDSSMRAAYDHMREAWALRPTGIFTVSDPGAWGALKWLEEHGISVPGEVSVLGFENVQASRFVHPSLSSIAHPLKERARRIVDILCDTSQGAAVQEKVMPYLVARESTGLAQMRDI